ncbi:MAG: DUF3606 domain-containing protein [Rubrivivax sp.]|nr:MAG: DUF3606 domain-containing protein [Rubrivivax sp.]
MADDLRKKGAQDRLRINVNEAHELAYWTKELGCTDDELRAAIKSAGVMATAVRQHLARQRAKPGGLR